MEKSQGAHWIGGWVGFRAGRDDMDDNNNNNHHGSLLQEKTRKLV
jgi:hypothetical protein